METEKNKLATALSKAQGQIEAAKKTKENEFFSKGEKKSMYAELSGVIEVIQGPASENGLSVTFNFKSEIAEGKVWNWIRYVVRHESGEYFESDWVYMLMRGNTQHDFGSSNTYYRRQLLKAIYQIAEEDDDGNSQSLPTGDNFGKPYKDAKKKLDEIKKEVKLGDYVMPTGPSAGKKLNDIDREKLERNLQFLEKKDEKSLTPDQTDLLKRLKEFLK